MKPLREYGSLIQQYANSPHNLAELLIEMSSDFASSQNNKIRYEVAKAKFFVEHKHIGSEKPLSDAAVNSLWMLTEEGINHRKTEIYSKTLTSLMSSVKASLRSLENEARNQY